MSDLLDAFAESYSDAFDPAALAFMRDRLDRGKDIPVFVYGTLRSGHGNYSWASDGVVEEHLNATISGSLHFLQGHRAFPGVKLDGRHEVKGDVLRFDPLLDEFWHVVYMEIGAGYRVAQVKAKMPDGGKKKVLVFEYEPRPVGEVVPGNDWNLVSARRD